MWMFENNPADADIPQNEYEKICDAIMEEKGEDISNDSWSCHMNSIHCCHDIPRAWIK